jgi:hypothetical protein
MAGSGGVPEPLHEVTFKSDAYPSDSWHHFESTRGLCFRQSRFPCIIRLESLPQPYRNPGGTGSYAPDNPTPEIARNTCKMS